MNKLRSRVAVLAKHNHKPILQRSLVYFMLVLFIFSSFVPTASAITAHTEIDQADASSVAPLESEAAPKQEQLGVVDEDLRTDYLAQKTYEEPKQETKTPDADDHAHEITEERTATSREFENKDSGNTTEYYAAPTAYKEGDSFKELGKTVVEDTAYEEANKVEESFIDRVLPGSPQPEGFMSSQGPLNAQFKTLRNNDGVTVKTNNQEISMRPLGANPDIKPSVSKHKDVDQVLYENVWNNVDVMYEYRGDHVKEFIILNEAIEQDSFRFEVSGATMRLSQENPGTVEVLVDGKVVFVLPELTVNVQEKGFIKTNTHYVINNNVVTVKVDQKALAGLEQQHYPVVIDPAINSHTATNGIDGNSTYTNSYKDDGYHCTAPSCPVNVGVAQDNGPKTWRTMMRIPFNEAVGKSVLAATLHAYKYSNDYGWYGSDTTNRYYVTWAPCFGYNCVNGGAPWLPIDIGTEGHADVKELVEWMITNGQTGGWIYIFGDAGTYKGLAPEAMQLDLTYNTPPPAVTPVKPQANETIITTMPRLTGNAVTDADGDQISYSISLYNNGSFVATSGSLSVPTWTVPDGLLEDGNTYTWKIASMDPWVWTWSSGTKFTVDLRTDKDKTQTYDDVDPFSVNLADGNAYTSIASHDVKALGGNIGLNFDYNTPAKARKGLTGRYYNDGATRTHVLTRTDPNIDFEWGVGSPNPGVVSTNDFAVNWQGYFIAPQTGTYRFGGHPDDQISLAIDVNQNGTFEAAEGQFDAGCCSQQWSTKTVNLKEGQAYAISSWMIEHAGSATARLYVRLPNSPTTNTIIEQDWLRAQTQYMETADNQGLMARYYKDTDKSRQFKPSQQPYYLQRFPSINVNWGTRTTLPYDRNNDFADDFLVRFSGYLTVPTTGMYSFGSGADDGQRIYLNGTKIADKWNDHSFSEVWSGQTLLTAGQTVPIVLEYYDNTGTAQVNLLWNGPAGAGLIPTQYLSTSYNSLPMGWDLSVDHDGNLPYERLRTLANGNVELIDGDGTRHTYTWNGTGFKPPADESGVLNRNKDGNFTLQDSDGRTYRFSSEGTLQSVTTPTDDRKPATLKYDYQDNGGVPRLKKIVDGVDSNRYGEVFYGGESQCTTPSGFDTAPIGFVCAFHTYDGQVTNYYYKANKLSRVELPGNQITDFENDSIGRITAVRDELANDVVAAGQRTNDASVQTEASYDILGRAEKVKLPAANAGDSRQEHVFEYGFGKSKRHITDATEPNGYMQYIEYDNKQRTTKTCDIAALCDTTQWDPLKDVVLSTTDETGLKSTTIYDYADRPTDEYGPAPAAWYGADRKPLAAYVNQVPHKSTAYDENIRGLETVFYTYTTSSKSLTGTPKLRATGFGQNPNGDAAANWGATKPITPDTNPNSTTNWGLRATGYIDLPQTGTYTFRFHSDDGVRLLVDDQLVSEDWTDGAPRSHGSGTFANTTAGPKRITVEHYDAANANNDAILELYLKAPGSNTETLVQGTSLMPGYGLATTSTTHDAQLGNTVSTTSYGANPELGLVQSNTVDPTGLNYTTTNTYEAPSNTTFMRQTSKTLPAGTATNYAYYDATETRDNPCTTDTTEAYRQGGQLKLKTETDPDGAGTQTSRTTETIYDDGGKVVATRMNADAWTCMSYDTRERMVTTVYPTVTLAAIIPATGATASTATKPGRTVSNDYAVGGNPLVTSSNDGSGAITTTIDLLGRTVSYKDSLNTTTSTTYDSLGRMTGRTGPLGSEEFAYDSFNRLSEQKLDGTVVAVPHYDSYSRTSSVDYPTAGSQKLSSVARDDQGRTVGQIFTLGDGTTTRADSVTRSQSGQIVSGTENGTAKSYTYDKAGRLTGATIGANTYSYGFGAQDATCGVAPGNADSGKNSNRTTQTINGVTTTFCYDFADRLVTSSDAKYTNAQYDAHGNVIQLGTGATLTQFKYDSTDRNTKIIEGSKSTTYVRDVQNRIVQRGVINGTTTTTKYAFTQTGDTPDLLLNSAGAVVEKYIQLPGNVLLTLRPNESLSANQQMFSLPNLHGDIFTTTNANGVVVADHSYDPFGNKTSLALPSNVANAASYGWVGQHEKTTETNFTLSPTQMGARVYLPSLGRFLQVDPIEGGVENNYVYPPDAVNDFDLEGTAKYSSKFGWPGWRANNSRINFQAAKWMCGGWQMVMCAMPGGFGARLGTKIASKSPWIAKLSYKAGKALYNSKYFGRQSTAFGSKSFSSKNGWANNNNVIRWGWGKAPGGNKAFRIAIGPKSWQNRVHIDILKGKY